MTTANKKTVRNSNVMLSGCMPSPLSSYLKGLGVFRIVSEQADPCARAIWHRESLVISSCLDENALITFLMDQYRPTPIIAPWNGGSGFWGKKSSTETLAKIVASTNPQMEQFQAAVRAVQETIANLGLVNKPDRKQKLDLMRTCRASVPDEAVQWLDAAFVLSEDKARYPALLGTGANDGNMDFTANFMHNLTVILDLNPEVGRTGAVKPKGRRRPAYDMTVSEGFLRDSLFGSSTTPLANTAIGQFNPGAVGGPNATRGFEAGTLLNPWDYVLALEGSLMFAGSIVWRLGTSSYGMAAFPFSVNPSAAGLGSVSQDGGEARAETWVPLWDRPASYIELQRLFAEGRAQVAGRRARNGTDFVRAVAGLGVDRGVGSFVRYGFMKRSGLSYLSVPLGRFHVAERSAVNLIADLDPWLDSLRRLASDSKGPGTYRRALRQVEDAVFDYCTNGRASELLDLLAAVGRAERAVAVGSKSKKPPRPLARLSSSWIDECGDSLEFRLALSLASISHPAIGRFRSNLQPVALEKGRWKWADDTSATPYGAELIRGLEDILENRIRYGIREGLQAVPLDSIYTVSPAEVGLFLAGHTDDSLLLDLLWAVTAISSDMKALGDLAQKHSYPRRDLTQVPRAYAMLKLLMLPSDSVAQLAPAGSDTSTRFVIRPEPSILSALRAGRLDTATRIAVRRLRSVGMMPVASGRQGQMTVPGFVLPPTHQRRLAASLLFPVNNVRHLAQLVLLPSEDSR